MAAYPLTAFSYPSPSPLPIQFQQPYLTAVPMACKYIVMVIFFFFSSCMTKGLNALNSPDIQIYHHLK